MPRKFPIHEKAPEAPFKCILSGLRGPVVDMDKYVEGYGRVYLHTSIVAAMAEAFGFLLDVEANKLREELAQARAEADRWPGVLALLEEEINDLVASAADRARGGGSDRRPDGAAAADALSDREGAAGLGDPAGAGDGSPVVDDDGRLPSDAALLFDQPAVLSE